MRPGRPGELVLPALVAAGAALAYAGTLANGFVFDDHDLIANNPAVREAARFGELISAPLFGGPAQGALGLYRPVLLASFWLDARWTGLRPAGFHGVNLLIHAANSAFVCGLARRLARGAPAAPWSALLAGLLFAVHPVNVDAVAQVSGRSDLLATLAILGCLLLSARRSRPARLAAGAALGFLAPLAKETGFILPLLLLLVPIGGGDPAKSPGREGGGRWRDLRERLAPAAAAAAGALGCLALRWSVLGWEATDIRWTDNPLAREGMATRGWTALSVLGRYFALLLLPRRLSVDYSFDSLPVERTPLGAWPAAGAIGLLAIAALLWGAMRSGRSHRSPVAGAAILLIPLVPVINFPTPTANLMAERYLYLPSAGLGLLAGWAFTAAAAVWAPTAGSRSRDPSRWRLRPAAGIVACIAAGLLAAASARTVARCRDFRDDLALFASAERVVPRNVKVLSNLAYEHNRRGDRDRALELLRRAVAIAPEFAENLVNLGNVYADAGRLEEAMEVYRRALGLAPADPLLHRNMANVLGRSGMIHEAIAEYETALRLDGAYHRARLELAGLLLRQGDWPRAYRESLAVLEADPGSGLAAFLASRACYGAGELDGARTWAARAQALGLTVPGGYLVALGLNRPPERQ